MQPTIVFDPARHFDLGQSKTPSLLSLPMVSLNNGGLVRPGGWRSLPVGFTPRPLHPRPPRHHRAPPGRRRPYARMAAGSHSPCRLLPPPCPRLSAPIAQSDGSAWCGQVRPAGAMPPLSGHAGLLWPPAAVRPRALLSGPRRVRCKTPLSPPFVVVHAGPQFGRRALVG